MRRFETGRGEKLPAPDEREKAEIINAEVDRYLRSGLETSAQQAADRIIPNEAVLYQRYEKEVGNYAEEIIARALDELLGSDRIIEAPLTVDRAKPPPGENPLGKGQADFLIAPDPKRPQRIAVQMFLHQFGRTDPGRGRTDAEVLRAKLYTAYEQAYVRGPKSSVIPLTLLHPRSDVVWRALTEWETNRRHGTPADYVPVREKERLAVEALSQMAHVLESMAAYHKSHQHLVAAYQSAQRELVALKKQLEEQIKRKTGGPELTPGPPAQHSTAAPPDASRQTA